MIRKLDHFFDANSIDISTCTWISLGCSVSPGRLTRGESSFQCWTPLGTMQTALTTISFVSNEDCEKSILWRLHGQSRISVALCLFRGSTDPEAHRLGHSSALFCKSVVCISGSVLVARSQGNVIRILYRVLLTHAWLRAAAWVAISVFSVLQIVTTFKHQFNTCVCLFVDDTRFKEE
jgi:hypothetical protein